MKYDFMRNFVVCSFIMCCLMLFACSDSVKPDNDYVFLCNLDSVMNKIGNVSACRY